MATSNTHSRYNEQRERDLMNEMSIVRAFWLVPASHLNEIKGTVAGYFEEAQRAGVTEQERLKMCGAIAARITQTFDKKSAPKPLHGSDLRDLLSDLNMIAHSYIDVADARRHESEQVITPHYADDNARMIVKEIRRAAASAVAGNAYRTGPHGGKPPRRVVKKF